MRRAATSLLGLKVLDVKSELPEDHDEFGVVEPDVEKLEVGDDGVGRLVTIKDEEGENLLSLVIGDQVRDNPEHRYVRVPTQDLVYEVELDDSALTTSFNAWIEDDLLQLSSLDIASTDIRKYSVAAQLTLDGRIGVDQQRAYDADLSIDDTNEWSLDRLIVYDETNTGTSRTLAPSEELNTTTLNQMKNALDDLKIVDVKRKPEGMSADLKADKSLMDNEESLRSLMTQGFYPTRGDDNALEILATNGEVIVDLRDGVQYLLRFGGVAGIATADEVGNEETNSEDQESGAERYLLVTARVNEAMIPQPAVQPVPESLEQLAAMRAPADPNPAPGPVQENPLAAPENAPTTGDGLPAGVTEEDPAAEDPAAEDPALEDPAAGDAGDSDAAPAASEKPADDTPADPPAAEEDPQSDDPVDPPTSEASGQGSTTAEGQGGGSGAGQEPSEQPPAEAASEEQPPADPPEAPEQPPAEETPAEQPPAEEAPSEQAEASGEQASDEQASDEQASDEQASDEQASDEGASDEGASDEGASDEEAADPSDQPPAEPQQPANPWDDMTEEEQQEYLEAEQEKIKEENQRLLDEWNEQIEAARRRVRELNARFADWYYIVPESTYADLQFPLNELIQEQGESDAPAQNPGTPQFNIPGAGGFPGLPGQP